MGFLFSTNKDSYKDKDRSKSEVGQVMRKSSQLNMSAGALINPTESKKKKSREVCKDIFLEKNKDHGGSIIKSELKSMFSGGLTEK